MARLVFTEKDHNAYDPKKYKVWVTVHKMNNKHKIKCLSIGSTQEPLEAGKPSAAAFEQEMVGGSRCHCCVSTEHSMPNHQLRWKRVVFKHTCQYPSPSSAFRAFYGPTEEKTKYYLYRVL